MNLAVSIQSYWQPACGPVLRRLWPLVFMLLGNLMCTQSSGAADAVASEYKVKAALLYKLTHFVEWPESSPATTTREFGICVLGENVFGDILEPLRGRRLKGLSIKVDYYLQSNEVSQTCNLLFISQSKRAFLKDILNSVAGAAVLTISDINDFASQGGMIEFRQEKDSIGFSINLEQARRTGLTIAAPLLQMANVIGHSGG